MCECSDPKINLVLTSKQCGTIRYTSTVVTQKVKYKFEASIIQWLKATQPIPQWPIIE